MLRITHGKDKIEVRFYHEIYEPYEIEGLTGIDVDENRRCTLAIIRLNGVHTGQGTSICHPEDNFCRKIGRKRALKDALFSLGRKIEQYRSPSLIKELRTAIWDEYKAKCNI